MHRYLRHSIYLAFFALLSNPLSAWGKALEDRQWLRVSSDNFTINSLLSEKKTIRLARQLEMFRAAVFFVTGTSDAGDAIPTEVYALRGQRDFQHLRLDREFQGGFTGGLRSNTVLMRGGDLEELAGTLHRYVHFLLGNQNGQQMPYWYDEGLAEYLSVVKVRGDAIVFGKPVRKARDAGRGNGMLQLRDILAVEGHYQQWNDDEKRVFHQQAGLLMAYLFRAADRKKSLAAGMQRYLELVGSGRGKADAFEQAFAVELPDLDRYMQRYPDNKKTQHLALRANQLVPGFKVEVSRPPREQVAIGLARVALQRGQLELAEEWFTIASQREETQPFAEAGLGDVFKFRGEFKAAQPRFEQAVALAPDSAVVQLDVAEYWHYRAMNTDKAEDRKQYLQSARSHYFKAWKLDDSAPETYAMYGQTYLMQGNYGRAIEMLEEAQRLLPANLNLRLILAEAYVGAGLAQQAATAAKSMIAWRHDDSIATRARALAAEAAAQTQ